MKFVKALMLLVASFATLLSVAQKKSTPGYYVSLNNDTVKGVFPAYSEWTKSPSNVEFQPLNGNSLTLTSSNCERFVVEGFDEYVAYNGNRLTNPIDDYELINSKGVGVGEDRHQEIHSFLRLLSKGPSHELYAFTDDERVNFYVRKGNSEIWELRYKKYYDMDRVHEIADYRQQLTNLFTEQIDKRRLSGSVQSLRYSDDALIRFFTKLDPVERDAPVVKKRASWIVGAGVSVNSVRLRSKESMGSIATNYKSKISPLVSVAYMVPLGRNFDRWFLMPQLKLFQYEASGEFTNATSVKNTTFRSDLVMGVDLNLGVHVLNMENFKVHVAAGAGLLVLTNNKQHDVRTYIYGEVKNEEFQMAANTFAYNFSVGATISKRFMLMAAYQGPTPVAEFTGYRPQLSAMQVTAAYKLKY